MNSNNLSLDPHNARKIIDQIGGSGQPPSYGIEFFSVGLELEFRLKTQTKGKST